MIYLIANRQQSTCKIGYSQNPKKRLAELQTSNSEKLELVTVVEGNKSVEKYLHFKFLKHNIRGEWFSYCQDIKNFFNIEDYIWLNADTKQLVQSCKGVELSFFIASTKHLYSNSSMFRIDKDIRKQLLIDTEMTNNTLNNCISRLLKKRILTKKDNCYSWPKELVYNGVLN